MHPNSQAICAYFAGNQQGLEKILEDMHIHSIAVSREEAPPGWLEKLHSTVGNKMAPSGRP